MLTEHSIVSMRELRAIVHARSGGRCESPLCGLLLLNDHWECHHRQLRKHGGPDCACNAVALHARCHTQGKLAVHDYPLRSTELGLLVPSWGEPELVALTPSPGPGSVLLSCGGTYT